MLQLQSRLPTAKPINSELDSLFAQPASGNFLIRYEYRLRSIFRTFFVKNADRSTNSRGTLSRSIESLRGTRFVSMKSYCHRHRGEKISRQLLETLKRTISTTKKPLLPAGKWFFEKLISGLFYDRARERTTRGRILRCASYTLRQEPNWNYLLARVIAYGSERMRNY